MKRTGALVMALVVLAAVLFVALPAEARGRHGGRGGIFFSTGEITVFTGGFFGAGHFGGRHGFYISHRPYRHGGRHYRNHRGGGYYRKYYDYYSYRYRYDRGYYNRGYYSGRFRSRVWVPGHSTPGGYSRGYWKRLPDQEHTGGYRGERGKRNY